MGDAYWCKLELEAKVKQTKTWYQYMKSLTVGIIMLIIIVYLVAISEIIVTNGWRYQIKWLKIH